MPLASGEGLAERVVKAVVQNDDDEKETLGEVLAESVIGLSKHEVSGKGSRKKKRTMLKSQTRKEKPERVRGPEPHTRGESHHLSEKEGDSEIWKKKQVELILKLL